MSWAQQSRDRIAQIHRSLPEDASLTARKKALRDGYPFGKRAYWPYKAWCKARREYLARFEKPQLTQRQLIEAELQRRGDGGLQVSFL